MMHSLLAASRGSGGPPGELFVVVFVVGGILILIQLVRDSRRSEVLRRFASEIGWRFENGVLLGPIQGRSSRIQFQEGKASWTKVTVPVPSFKGGSLEISRNTSIFGLFRGATVAIGDETFDAGYNVYASPKTLAGQVFAPERRRQVMATVRRFENPTITVEHRSLEIRVVGVLEEAGLRLLIQTADEMMGYLVDSEGIHWVESQSLAGICPVCTTPAAEPVAVCPRCRVPHHQQCWDYLGRCAVYGCDPLKRRRAG